MHCERKDRRIWASLLPALLAGAALWMLAPASARADLPAVKGFSAHATGPNTELVSAEIDPAGELTRYHVDYGSAVSGFCAPQPGDAGNPRGPGTSLPSPGALAGWGPLLSTQRQTLAFEDHQYHPVSVELPGLAPGDYCAQLVASNHSGETSSVKLPFTAGAPSVIGSHFAPAHDELQAEVDPAGQLSSYQVLYAPSASEWCTSGGAKGAPSKLGALTPLAFDDGFYHAVSVQLTGLVAGASYCAAVYAENGSGSALGSQVTFTQPAGPGSQGSGPPSSAPGGGSGGGAGPALGQSAQVGVTSGTVTVRAPGATSFAPFKGGTIPDGSEIDATHGVVIVTVRTPDGKTVSAEVFGGRFRIHQDKDGETHFILTLPLTGCARIELPRGAAAARINGRVGKPPKSRYLWVAEKGGRWGTNGRFVSTSVEGTRWLTLDECRRSVVRVSKGRVKVRNLVTRRTKTLGAGGRYVAHAGRPRHKRHH